MKHCRKLFSWRKITKQTTKQTQTNTQYQRRSRKVVRRIRIDRQPLVQRIRTSPIRPKDTADRPGMPPAYDFWLVVKIHVFLLVVYSFSLHVDRMMLQSPHCEKGEEYDPEKQPYTPQPVRRGQAPMRHVWVGNLGQGTTEKDVRDHFQECGPLESVRMVGSNAFLHFKYSEDGAKARKENGCLLLGVAMKIQYQERGSFPPSAFLRIMNVSFQSEYGSVPHV